MCRFSRRDASLTAVIGRTMKYQMIEYQKLISQLRAVRCDLDEKKITEQIQKLASACSGSTLDHLRHCIRLGMEGEPMPWEAS